MFRKSLRLVFPFLMIFASACAGPVPAATATQTIPALTHTPVPTDTPTITATALSTFTPTPEAVMLTFTKNAFCRGGPSTQYFDIGSFEQGATAQAVGRNDTDPRWWAILKSSGEICWVSDSTVGPNEAAASLPVMQPERSLPGTPPDLWIDRVCKPGKGFAVTFNWTPSPTAEGYYVYLNGELIEDVQNEFQKSYVLKLPLNENVFYEFEAYNSIGSGERAQFEDHCP
jgi:hypothetical protein